MKLYRELAGWWQFFSPVEEYADEAAFFIKILQNYSILPCRTILELGAGAGSNAFYLKEHFELTLVDLSAEMITASRAINPELPHIQGDMRSARLNREFDAVFIHDAICYMTSESDLQQVIETAFVHCKHNGLVVIAPDFVRETFKPATEHGGRDGDNGQAMRWLMWTLEPNVGSETYAVHFAFLLKDGEVVKIEHDRHTEGLFARETWLRLFEQAGFQKPKIIVDLYDREVFVAHKAKLPGGKVLERTKNENI